MTEPTGVTKQDLIDACDSIVKPGELIPGSDFDMLCMIRKVIMALPDVQLTWKGQIKEQRGWYGIATLIKGGKDDDK